MRLLLLKICVGAMYFIIGCSQIQVSGKFAQPKRLEQASVIIRPGYYSYTILKEPEKSITENWSRPNEELNNYATSEVYALPKKCNDSLKSSSVNNFKILHKLLGKSESLRGKQSVKVLEKSRKMTGRFILNTLISLNNFKKQGINKNVDKERKISFGNYLERTIQHLGSTTTSLPKTYLNSPNEKIENGISKVRKIRNIFPSLTNFKDLQDSIKATAYFGLYKDGNLSSFKHFNFHTSTHNFSNATQETSRLTRSNVETEDLTKKKTALSKFLLELQDALETIKFLTDGMFYQQIEESDEVLYNLTVKNATSSATSDGEDSTRKIRQISEEIDKHEMSHLNKKLIEMEKTLNQLTQSIANNRCNCCGLKRNVRETKHENCGNYEEISRFSKNLNSLLRDTSVGDFRKSGALMKLKKFQSELEKLVKQLGNTE